MQDAFEYPFDLGSPHSGAVTSLDIRLEISSPQTEPVTFDLAGLKGCEHGHELFRSCERCGGVEKLVVPCNSRFLRVCPSCSRRWERGVLSRFMTGIQSMKAPKLITLTLRKPCGHERFLSIWVLRQYLFHNLVRRGYAIRSWCGIPEYPNHIHLVVDCDYVPKHEIKQIWHGITGDSYIVDVKALRGNRDGFEGASSYLTKYLTKSIRFDPVYLQETVWGGATQYDAPSAETLDLRGFHLVGSWGLARGVVWTPLPHVCGCGGGFGAPFGMTPDDETAFLTPLRPPPNGKMLPFGGAS
jgi:hypothetical protein